MVRLPALIDDLAEHDARGRPMVEFLARVIREAGLIQTTGRGRAAAEMTPLDAAALLVGLCVSEAPKEAPDATRTYMELIPYRAGTRDMPVPMELDLIASSRNLGECIAHIILSVPATSALLSRSSPIVRNLIQGISTGQLLSLAGRSDFALTFRLPTPSASVLIVWQDNGRMPQHFSRIYGRGGLPDLSVRNREERSDRSIEVSLGYETFVRLHRLLIGPSAAAA
jgi:hypothetical protein